MILKITIENSVLKTRRGIHSIRSRKYAQKDIRLMRAIISGIHIIHYLDKIFHEFLI